MLLRTVGDVADLLDISPQTVRVWVDTFREWLSDSAAPQTGEVRRFEPHDLRVLALVAELRKTRDASFDDIKEILASTPDDALPVIVEPEPEPEPEPNPFVALSTLSREELMGQLLRMREEYATLEGRYRELQEQRLLTDEVREELQQVRQALLEAERRASFAEGKLEALQDREAPQPPTEAPPQPQRATRPWWKRLLG